MQIAKAIDEIRNGRFIVLIDDVDPSNEANLVIAAQMASAEKINQMTHMASGVICLSLTRERAEALRLPLQSTGANKSGPAFSVSIDAKSGVTTGISAADRARTITAAIYSDPLSDELVTPGHIFPVVAADGGVLVRPKATEGAVDIVRLASLNPSAVVCGVFDQDGEVLCGEYLKQFASEHGLECVSLSDLIRYRIYHDPIIVSGKKGWASDLFSREWHWQSYISEYESSEVIMLSPTDRTRDQIRRLRAEVIDPLCGVNHLSVDAASDPRSKLSETQLLLFRPHSPTAVTDRLAIGANSPPVNVDSKKMCAQVVCSLSQELDEITGDERLVSSIQAALSGGG